jgi:hypothetical protein
VTGLPIKRRRPTTTILSVLYNLFFWKSIKRTRNLLLSKLLAISQLNLILRGWCHKFSSESKFDSRQLATDLSLLRPGFAPGSVHVGFLVEKVAL